MATATANPWVGKSIKRKEDERLIKGAGQYLPDLMLPRMLYMGLVRSTHAHARIKSIDASRAVALPGVVAVITGDEFKAWEPVLSDECVPKLPGETKRPRYWPLPMSKVRYVGEPVVALVARDKYLLEDAMELVEIDYEPLQPVLDLEAALKPDSPLLYPEWGDNVVYHQHMKAGDPDKAFAEADLVVSERLRCHRTGAQPMETRGCVARYDAGEGLTLWLTTQRPHTIRDLLARYLRLPHDKMHVIRPKDMGSAFGTKSPLYREEILASHLAMKLERPIKWVENRMESLMNVGQERDQIHSIEVALKRDGTILAVRDRIVADCGTACIGIYVGFLMPFLGAMYLPNGNDIRSVDIDLTCLVTNKASITPVRSFGTYPGRFAIDRILDIAARRLGIDPLEMRRRNAIKTFPYTSPLGVHVDSGDFLVALDKAAATIGYDAFRAEQARAREQGRYLGVGFSMGVEMSGVSSDVLVEMEHAPGFGSATVRFDAHGKVQVAEGDAPHGQGHETTFAQAVAGELGLTPDDVYVTYGDTFSTPFSTGTIGSRGSSYTLSAAVLAARALRAKICAIAAHLLRIPQDAPGRDEFRFEDGEIIWSNDPAKRVSLREIAHAAVLAPTELPPGMEAGLEHTSYFEAPTPGMHSCNVHVATVEAVPETGRFKILRYVAVSDAGVPINPMIVRGQIHGGVMMGIGNATTEEYIYDENGQQLTCTLLDYHMLSALDMPNVEVIHYGCPSPHTPLGLKGKGEGIPGMCPAVLANAVEDALAPFGIKITSLPLKSEYIWRLLHPNG